MYKQLLYLQAGRPAVCLWNCLRTGHAASYPPIPVSLFFFQKTERVWCRTLALWFVSQSDIFLFSLPSFFSFLFIRPGYSLNTPPPRELEYACVRIYARVCVPLCCICRKCQPFQSQGLGAHQENKGPKPIKALNLKLPSMNGLFLQWLDG